MAGSHRAPVTYLVGRSAEADIVLADATVSRLHAELVRAADGTWYLTDRGSTGGTHRLDAGGWVPIVQGFVRPGDRLRLGGLECTLDDLLSGIQGGAGAAGPAHGPPHGGSGTGSPVRDDRPDGPVRRDPRTGDILSVEDD